jgi:hypothetical protein
MDSPPVVCRSSICQARVVRGVVRPARGVVRSAYVLSVAGEATPLTLRCRLLILVQRLRSQFDRDNDLHPDVQIKIKLQVLRQATQSRAVWPGFRSHEALRGHGANMRRTQDSRVCTAVCDIAAVGTIV